MSPDRALERAEAKRRVGAALESLSDRDREVLVLKEFEGLRYREIAEIIGVPIGTVMSRLYSARRRLAAALEEDR
jgi:RNA polymerase sigma-70 factor (ECF subfamily)